MAKRKRRKRRKHGGKEEEAVRLLTRGREPAIRDLCNRLVSSGIAPLAEPPEIERSAARNTTRSWQQLWECPLRWGIGPGLVDELLVIWQTDGQGAAKKSVPGTVDPKVRKILFDWLRDHGFVR